MMDILIRKMTEEDLPEVVDIENQSFSDPWSLRMLTDSLHNTNCHCLVALSDKSILGFAFFLVVADESEIMDIAVLPQHRKNGIGYLLLNEGLSHVQSLGAQTCYLEVRLSNIPAQSLYLSHGFELIGRRKSYYQNPKEDALLMRYSFPRKESK